MPDLAAEAQEVLRQACQAVGLNASGAQLLRLRSNAVYKLQDPIVVRISRSATAPARMPGVLTMTRWLHDQGFPTVRPLDVEQPLVLPQATVTFWHYLTASPERPTTKDLGFLLRRLHTLPTPPFELRQLTDPLASIRHDLHHRPGILAPAERSWLTGQIAELTATWQSLPGLGSARILHGDAWIDNLLLQHDGHPVLHDWDAVAIGDTPWDLIHTYHGQNRFGIEPSQVDDFANAYGFDLRDWAGYAALMRVRDLYAIGIHVRNAPGDHFSSRELRHRLDSLMTGDATRRWNLRG
ncbi:phosphotransferase [Spirillospora sp. NPDC048911]|uniref:phosphotransferase n=1 Tax=Spirillospora sp. NPDC048911 TaxID=3364527 RepID=UPI00371674DD